ncbi:MAG: hypothetical protein WCW54_02890 [Candidatus Paceibacterota bacterium]
MRKYFVFLLIILSTFIALPIYAFTPVNSGFIPGQIWYSKETLVEGDTVNIHTAVWNGESHSIIVNVEFYDKNVVLGSRDVVLAPLLLEDVYIPWKVTSGDHTISAKIISSIATISGKKEKVVLPRIITSSDKQFVSVVIKNNVGENVSETDIIKNKIVETTSGIVNIVPDNVSTSLSDSFTVLDNFRNKTLAQVDTSKKETQKEIGKVLGVSTTAKENPTKINNIPDATEKPIAYIKLFFLSVLSFIFGSKIVFYGTIILIVFFFVRWIYRKIRNR